MPAWGEVFHVCNKVYSQADVKKPTGLNVFQSKKTSCPKVQGEIVTYSQGKEEENFGTKCFPSIAAPAGSRALESI